MKNGFFYFVLSSQTVIAARCGINWETGEVSNFSDVMPIENGKSYANGAFVVELGSELLIPVIKAASADAWRKSGADPMKSLWRKEELTVPASLASVWDGCNEISSDCRVNMDTREVFDIEVVDDDAIEDVEVLDEQHSTILDENFQVYEEAEYKDCNATDQQQGYWYR